MAYNITSVDLKMEEEEMIKEIGIAFLGLGTVGSHVLKIIQEKEDFFKEEFNICFRVHYVYVRDVHKKRNVPLENIIVTNDIEEIINSPQVDICIECMGGSGTEKTYDFILRLIQKGKHIVMSSKKCLALYKNEIVDMVDTHNVQLRYDATVGGSIPICKVLQNMSGFDPINKIWGIANATTNYILTLVCNEGLSYNEALIKAREEGYAENDVSDDLSGCDALYKMCILLRFGARIDVNPQQMIANSLEPLTNISSDKPKENIKQIFCAEKTVDNKLRYYVGPTIVSRNTLLGDVKGENNIIFVEHEYGGTRAYYGAGAGGKETAAIMVEDLIDIIINNVRPKTANQCLQLENLCKLNLN